MFKTLLLAVDTNDPSGTARCTEAALKLSKPGETVLHVVNVVPDSGMAIVGSMLGPDHSKNMMAQASGELEAWAKEALPSQMAANLHVAEGRIYDQIIKAAEKTGADAIIVGAHRPELKDYLIGPNSARVARHATQSVFVIR